MNLLSKDNNLACLSCRQMRLGDYGFYCNQYNLTLTKDEDKMPVQLAKCTEGSPKHVKN